MTNFPQKLLDGYQGFLHLDLSQALDSYRDLAASRPEARRRW
jgi:hypothetical protein